MLECYLETIQIEGNNSTLVSHFYYVRYHGMCLNIVIVQASDRKQFILSVTYFTVKDTELQSSSTVLSNLV